MLGTFKQLREESQMKKEPAGPVKFPNRAGIFEYSQLESEIRKLQLKLQTLTGLQREHILKHAESSLTRLTYYLEIKKLPKVYKTSAAYTTSATPTERKEGQRPCERIGKKRFLCQRWIMSHEKNALQSWLASLSTDRKAQGAKKRKWSQETNTGSQKVQIPTSPKWVIFQAEAPEGQGLPSLHRAPQERTG